MALGGRPQIPMIDVVSILEASQGLPQILANPV